MNLIMYNCSPFGVQANADTLRLDNQRLLGVEEANRKTILDLVNDQVQW